MSITNYLFSHFDRIWPRLVEHLTLSGISLGIAMLIALPLGLILSRAQKFATPVLGLLGVIYTIPSFAFFAFLVPFTGIGAQPAIIALSAYALVVLARNTMVAFTGVDPAIKEAARGMGMSPGQVLRRIEIPLALPIIVAGTRIAALSTIGLTTVAAWVGAGGLGQLLKDGMSDPTYSKLYAGIICVGAIAIGIDIIFRLVERLVSVPTPRKTQQMISDTIVPTGQPKQA
ncbi:MAG: ABC transporter permease [Chloroflexota bacterium]|nr:ABC transporter permease [Chloroflexota bacterium]